MSAPAGRAVLITGCSSGIGLAAARGLAGRGYRVLASARRPESRAALAGEGFETVALDLGEPAGVGRTHRQLVGASEGDAGRQVFGRDALSSVLDLDDNLAGFVMGRYDDDSARRCVALAVLQ